MHKILKKRIWGLIDEHFSKLNFISQKKSGDWRLFKSLDASAALFIAVEYFDVAGGKFAFYLGVSLGGYPSQKDAPVSTFERFDGIKFVMVKADVLGLPHALLSVELDWQTPSEALVNKALSLEDARPILDTLGVTSSARHHLLSHEILESFGVDIPESEFDVVLRNTEAELGRIVDESVRPGLMELSERFQTPTPTGST